MVLTLEEALELTKDQLDIEIVIQGGRELEEKMGAKAYDKLLDKINKRLMFLMDVEHVGSLTIRTEGWENPRPLVNRAGWPKYTPASVARESEQRFSDLVHDALKEMAVKGELGLFAKADDAQAISEGVA
ncbi:MAG: hypothetical protein GYA23_09365 [Methanomicrobiales archaeon]|nr:hypothetical protein [Methanomicrobiales archaeon]